MLESGDKVLVAHRRLFEKDEPRYFVGQVLAYAEGVVKIRGHSFVRDVLKGSFVRKDDPRTKIVSIASGTFMLYQLPKDADLEAAKFEAHDAELVLTDGQTLKMNMAEHPNRGQI